MTSRARIAAVTLLTVAASLVAVPAAPAHASPAPCLIAGPEPDGCAGAVTFSSHALSTVFRPFQGTTGTGSQPDIVVTFGGRFVNRIRITANDPDYSGTRARVRQIGCCYVPLDFAVDNQPGSFTASHRTVATGQYDRIELQSDDRDYVNWRVEYQNDGHAGWCKVTTSVSPCHGVSPVVSPLAVGSVFDPFQSIAGSGPQVPIDITFAVSQVFVAATAVDPDFPGSQLEAYDAVGALLGTAPFAADDTPNLSSVSTAFISDARGIARIRLVPAPNDYVAFQGVTVIGR